MSEGGKPLAKPKVRFTQSPDDSNPPGPFQGPKIREIVTLKQPVRLVTFPRNKNTSSDHEDVVPNPSRAPPSPQKAPPIPKITIPPPEPQIPAKNLKKNPTIPPKSSQTPRKSPPDMEYLQKKLAELKTSDKNRQKNPRDVKKPLETKKIDKSNEKIPPKSILRSKNTPEIPGKSGRPLEVEKKIGNKENVNKKELKSTQVKNVKKSKAVEEKKKENICSDVLRRSFSSGGGSTRRGSLGLMPCMKKKIEVRNKTKVNVLRNVARPIGSVFVGAGVPRDRDQGTSCKENVQVKEIDGPSGDELSRPEYNSIVCTIKKMDQVRKKKVVGNLENLPGFYKDLVNGKVSSALDFTPCESVYHDLVDISIDEKQLPIRLMRSRDPEPRPKDFVPKLSDFFVPQYQKEYSVAVKVRPRTPQIIDKWSGFSISDKINSWKMSLDEPSN